MEAKQFGEEERLGNGDPVIAIRLDINEHDNGRLRAPSREVVTLGTGFEGWDDLYRTVERVIETGEPTLNVPSEAASKLEGADNVRFFTGAAILKSE